MASIGIEGLDPVIPIPIAKIARRRAACIGDQDIGVRQYRQNLLAPFGRSNVGGDRAYFSRSLAAQLVGRRLKPFRPPCHQDDIHASHGQ
jgi:hypothetical protein